MSKLTTEQRTVAKRYTWEQRIHKVKTYAEIAEGLEMEYGISVSSRQIGKWLSSMTNNAQARLYNDIINVKREQTAQLERMAQQALAGWDSSRQPVETDEGHIQRDGNPRFIREARACLKEIRDIWGIQPTEFDGELNIKVEYAELPEKIK